ncbi:PBS lyase HEAT-like repeat domain protein [Synechococcus sp. PCC 7335]|uniref:HEAT repeat domain-containing protein n=1 Tax=Synechococcus sp. (strain ATCC 29403 / PCC 7335) TaxID=91464 RepID=UPI00017EE395|nr:HEAT repeat domain-containing protein [Synechococcus sp. PCC 7335]EDX86800.1 PBS lyase HEAT-like repeat domain protein [Synechococcus sp. PCC 7335]
MEISEIKTLLASEDSQLRLRALVALRDYDANEAVPLLIKQRQDNAFLVRSFVAMGLGRKRNESAYTTLLAMLPVEPDQNVKAEIANSLGLYGKRSVDCLVELFKTNDHWLVRRSILAIMPEMDCPEELFEVAMIALEDKDETISQAGISALALLADTSQSQKALEAILPTLQNKSWRSRLALANALRHFTQPAAKDTLLQLRQDKHHKVVAAALEALVPN